MKTFLLPSLLSLAVAATVLPASAIAAEKTAEPTRPIRLQVQVDLPFSMNPIRDDDLTEAFAHRMIAALHEQGFRGRIEYVPRGENPRRGLPMLDVNIVEWRVSRMGNTDCVFHARLTSPRGEKDLGIFSGTSILTWLRRDWWSRADSFEDAARDAMNNLKSRIDASELLEPVGGPTA